MSIRLRLRLEDLRSDIDDAASEADERELNHRIHAALEPYLHRSDELVLDLDLDGGGALLVPSGTPTSADVEDDEDDD